MRPDLGVAVVGEFPPPPGGMARQAELLCRHLAEEGVRVFRVRTNPPFSGAWRRLERVRGLRGLIRFCRFLSALAATVGRVDVLHVISNSYLSFFLFTAPAVLCGRLFGKRTVVNYHGGSADAFFRAMPPAKMFLRLAGRAVVPSGYLREVFERHGLEALVVPNVADLGRFTYRRRERLRPLILVARHLEPLYNVACALRVFALVRRDHPGARLTVAGDGSQRRRLEEMSAALGLDGAVRFTGNVPNEEMPRLYGEADILLNTSDVDNMPVAIQEAFAAGLPVVSTRAGGIPHLVEDGRTGLLADLGDAEGLARAVLRLLRNPAEASALAERARAAAESWSWSALRDKWLALYEAA